jgi:Resolvase, N terminal domain
MTTNGVRAAIYVRVSRDDQTTENQRLVLARVAGHRGWLIVQTYEDQGISGATRSAISAPKRLWISGSLTAVSSTTSDLYVAVGNGNVSTKGVVYAARPTAHKGGAT